MMRLLIGLFMCCCLGGLISCGGEEEVKVLQLVSVEADVATVSEDVGSVSIKVFLDSPNLTGENINVIYATSGNVTIGDDYEKLRELVTIPINETEAFVTLNIIDDNVKEGNETFAISLANTNLPEGIGLGSNTFIITITDND